MIWKLRYTIVFWILVLEQSVFGLNCRNIRVESRTLNKTLGTLKNEIFKNSYSGLTLTLNFTNINIYLQLFKNYLKILKWHNFLNFILEQSVFELNCRNIRVESRTLNRTFGTLGNEILKNYLKTSRYHSFWNFDFSTKCIWTYL